MSLFSLAMDYVASQVESAIKEAVAPLAPYLRRLSFGFVLVFLAAVAWQLTLLFLGAALFLSLVHYPYPEAALWTAGAFFLLGGVLAVFGMGTMRKPR